MEPTTPTLGLAHLLAQSDAVGKTLLATLVLMSIASWALIAIKGYAVAAPAPQRGLPAAVLERRIRWTRCSTS
jgi:biopolymer transport protein ExbB/TolQ